MDNLELENEELKTELEMLKRDIKHNSTSTTKNGKGNAQANRSYAKNTPQSAYKSPVKRPTTSPNNMLLSSNSARQTPQRDIQIGTINPRTLSLKQLKDIITGIYDSKEK